MYSGSENVAVSFNGGKDCTVLLHLLKRSWVELKIKEKLKLVNVKTPYSFTEADDYVHELVEVSSSWIHFIEYEGNLKESFSLVLQDYPNIKAIFVGVRKTDPGAENYKVIQATDNGWPKFDRIQPLLEWGYTEIWDYIRRHDIIYCKLYDQGYSSLGNITNTKRNPFLILGNDKYRKPYELKDETEERSGR